MSTDPLPKGAKVIDITPRRDDAIKPAELIQITGHQDLTLNARRSITILWHCAQMQGVQEGKDYQIEIDRLKPADHKGNEMVEEAIEALMRSILKIRLPDGRTRRVQFLGGNDLDDPERADGILTYSFDKRLVEILQDSTIWGKISIPVLMSFTSKYAVSLYENIAKLTNLTHKKDEEFPLGEFREMLGVNAGKYKTFGELNKHVIKPAVNEINLLADFNISIIFRKTGRRVTHVTVGWWRKTDEERQTAWQEIGRHKAGRKARSQGLAEYVHAPIPSDIKQIRNDPFLKDRRRGGPRKPHSSSVYDDAEDV
ncbi:MAG: replication initiation protein [Gammaproteobacteria bacterium]